MPSDRQAKQADKAAGSLVGDIDKLSYFLSAQLTLWAFKSIVMPWSVTFSLLRVAVYNPRPWRGTLRHRCG